ncbi:MAG: PEP-CTERM sorting domain-containing protein [Bryobacteraceae bacterium]|jgi:hypothetical protein
MVLTREVEMLRIVGAVVIWLFLGSPVRAGMVGDQVSLTWFLPDLSTIYLGPATATVGAGVEFPASTFPSNPAVSVDLTDTTITFTGGYQSTFNAAAFNGFGISDLTHQNFSAVSILSATNDWVGFSSSRVSFDAGHVYVNFASLPLSTSDQLVLQVTQNSVPEPGTFALLLSGLIIAFLWRLRKNFAL